QPQRQREIANEIAEKHHRAVEQRDDDHVATTVIALDLAAHFADAPREHFVRDEDALDVLAPARRDGSARTGELGQGGLGQRAEWYRAANVCREIFQTTNEHEWLRIGRVPPCSPPFRNCVSARTE